MITVVSIIVFVVSRPSYASENPAETALCQSVKEGKFMLDNYSIVRNSGIHTETDIHTGEKTIYKVNWITNCEFELINTADSTDVTGIKITSVSEDVYQCVAIFDGRTTKHKLKIVK